MTKQLKVLVIDDARQIREVLALLLETHGFVTDEAEDGEEAWNKLTAPNATLPDLLIIDYFMPRLNGFQLVERLKENPALVGIPRIMVTGADKKADLNVNGEIVLAKPFNLDDLMNTVVAQLEGKVE